MAWTRCPFVLAPIAIAIALPGCDKPPPAPEPPPPIVTPTASDDGPPGVKHEYKGAEDDGEVAKAEDTGEVPEAKPPAEDKLTVDAANALVATAIDEAIGSDTERVVTIALPPAWPLAGSEVVYFVYPLAPETGGVSRYLASTPSKCVHLDVTARTTRVVDLGKSKKLGTFEQPRIPGDAVPKAEQALLDLAAGKVVADKVRYLLAAYGKWFDAHGKVGVDAEKRAAAFAKWAREWGR